MKKILCLVLALVLALVTVTAAFAVTGSKEDPGGGGSGEGGGQGGGQGGGDSGDSGDSGDEGGSRTISSDDTVIKILIKFITDTDKSAAEIQKFLDAKKNGGSVLDALPEEIRNKLNGAGETEINEMRTVQFDGAVNKVGTDVEMTVKFDTPYAAGVHVTVLLGILKDPVEWHTFDGVGLADGSVRFTVPKAIFETIQTAPFLLGVASKPAAQ